MLKKLAIIISLCAILNPVLAKQESKNDFFVNLATDDTGEKVESKLEFIKQNESVMDFLGDGWILLYGGISLVAISITGIIFVLMPKKNKNSGPRKRSKKNNGDNRE